MLHPGMTSRHNFVDHWGSLPTIPTSIAKIGDVIKFRYSHGRQPPVQAPSSDVTAVVEFPPHCPGTSSSEPLWYDDQLRTWIGDVGIIDTAQSPLPSDPKRSSEVGALHAGLWESNEDFGLSAARVRIENRYIQQQQHQQHQHRTTDILVDSGSNRDSLRRSTAEDNVHVKSIGTRTKKDRNKDSQLVGSTVKCTDRRKYRPQRRSRRAVGAGSSSSVLLKSVGDMNAKTVEDHQTGNVCNNRTTTVGYAPSTTTTHNSLEGASADVAGHVTGGDSTRSSQDTLLYADPVVDSSISFQQRLAQMATLEAETRRTERQAALVSRAKRKQAAAGASSKES